MNKLSIGFLFLATFYFNTSYGQEYKFDKVIKSEFSTPNFPDQERIHLINSKNVSYYMQIYNQNDSLKSRIFDHHRRQIHYFYIDKSDSLRLNYIQTGSWTKQPEDYRFEFSKLENSNKVVLKIFNKKKRRIAKYRFTIQETEQNLFNVFIFSATESFHDVEIIAPFKFIVLKAKGRNISGNSIKYELTSIEDVELSISIPPNINH